MSAEAEAYARFGVRVAAGAIDLTLLLCAAAVITWAGVEIQATAPESRTALIEAVGRLWREALLLPVVVLAVAGMAFSWTRILATPGQLLMGCRVVRRRRDEPLNIFIAAWRAVALLALAGPAAVPLLTMFLDPRRRAAHDWLSDSVVMMEDESRVTLDEWLSRLG